jgi:hypothetical protein
MFVGSTEKIQRPFPVLIPEAPQAADEILTQPNPAAGFPGIDLRHQHLPINSFSDKTSCVLKTRNRHTGAPAAGD